MLIDDLIFSDHRYVLLSIDNNCGSYSDSVENVISVINYEKLDTHPIWNNLNEIKNFNELIQKLMLAINENREEIVRKPRGNQPWMNNYLLRIIKERNKFYKYTKKYKNDCNVKNKYIEFKNLVRKTNNELKKAWFDKNLNSCISEPRKFWSYLKYAVYNKKYEPPSISINKNNSIISDSETIANEFNRYFVSVAKNIVTQIPTQTSIGRKYIDNLEYNIETNFILNKVLELDIINAIKSLNLNASCGIYEISTKIIVKYIDKLAPALTTLINDCIERNTFPDILKTAKIIPIFKGGDETDIDNYRGIAILIVFAKIFEIILFIAIHDHFEKNSIISPVQFGFSVKSNTTAACLELTHFISTSLDKKLFVSCIFLDLSKAFDTVDRSLLLYKLAKVGVSGDNLKMFESYLCNRNQAVFINDKYSSYESSDFGVPQGSNLGPLLFIFFINDIANLKLYGKIQIFADDIAIKYEFDNIDTLFYQMQQDLCKLMEWFNNNKLVINVKKSKYMLFKISNNNIIKDKTLTYNGELMQQVSEYKYLGLIIKEDVKGDKQVDYDKQKINPYIFSLKKLKNILSPNSLKFIYYSYIYSHIIYLNPIWSGCSQYKLDQLYVLQKRALKYVLNVHWRHPTQTLFENEFKSLPLVIEYELLVLIYKILNNTIKHNFIIKQIKSLHEYNTRRRSNYNINFFSSDMCMQNVLYKGLNIYNKLPAEIKELNSLRNFKNKLIEYLPNKF